MSSASDRVVDEVLSLPANVRLGLIEKILTSLNLPIDAQIDRLWAEEAERRVSQVDAGKAKLVPGKEVFGRIRSKRRK